MKLYLISQDENTLHDVYDAAIVAAPDEETAKLIHPAISRHDGSLIMDSWGGDDWASGPQHVKVQLIGTAARGTKMGVVLASYNAG